MKQSHKKTGRNPQRSAPRNRPAGEGPLLQSRIITSAANPRIKEAVHLRKRHERDRTGLMLVEGVRELRLAVRFGVTIREVFVCSDLIKTDEEHELLYELEGIGMDLVRITPRLFGKIAYREGTGGFVATAERPERSLEELPLGDDPLILVVDAVEKPGNLGAILRTADAAGVTGLIVSNPRTDITNPNAVRASIGTIFTVPWVQSTAAEAARWLRNRGTTVITATPAPDAAPYTEADLTGSCAIVVGSEDTGAGKMWLDTSDLRIRIPMEGRADSLNVSISASIILFEALRQRKAR